MKDVINQLKENNALEKERDSNLNRNIANLRTSNVRAAADIQKQIFVGQGEVKEEVDKNNLNGNR